MSGRDSPHLLLVASDAFMTRYAAHVESLRQAVQEGPGQTGADLRQAVSAYAAEHCHGDASIELPDDLVDYVDTVALHAYKVTDEDVAKLKEAGRSEDEIFEVTVAAAVGAALERLDIGLRALRGDTE